jgi:type II secretory pathway component PulF
MSTTTDFLRETADLLRKALFMKTKAARNVNVRLLEEGKNVPPAKRTGLQGMINRAFFSTLVREGFYEFLSTQIQNGQQDIASMETYRDRMTSRKRMTQAAVISDIIRRLKQSGGSWEIAFTPWVPADEVRIIDGGERSGNLPKALETISTLNERKAELRSKVRAAATTPALSIFVIYAFLLFIGIYVTPIFSRFLPNPTGIGAMLYAEGDFVDSWEAFVPPVIAFAMVWGFIFALPRWTGRVRALADRFMPFSFFRDVKGYVWVLTFMAMLRANTPDTEIIAQQMQRADPWLRERLRIILIRLRAQGGDLPVILRTASVRGVLLHFPNEGLIDAIESIYGHADTAERMQAVVDRWSNRFDKKINKKIRNFSTYAQLTVYAIMAFLLIALNDVSGQLSTSAMFH